MCPFDNSKDLHELSDQMMGTVRVTIWLQNRSNWRDEVVPATWIAQNGAPSLD
jgi:hypothetical protein